MSKRQRFTILILIVTLLILCQTPSVIRSVQQHYLYNPFLSETKAGSTQGSGTADGTAEDTETYADEMTVLYAGEEGSESEKIAKGTALARRCRYGLYEEGSGTKNTVVLIDMEYTGVRDALSIAGDVTKEGGTAVAVNLPEPEEIENNKRLMKMLGIEEVRKESVHLTGIHIYDGFLMGGEVIYDADTEEHAKSQDLDLTVPWYTSSTATKTFAVGILTEDMEPEEKNLMADEKNPLLIWRHSYSQGYVYSVLGDFFDDATGSGILMAIISDSKPLDIYPVVNAQVLSILHYPALYEENTDVMLQLYGRTTSKVMSDLVWPELYDLYAASGFIPTCFIAPVPEQESLSPETKATDLTQYLKMMGERRWEPAITAKEGTDEEELEHISSMVSGYPFSAVYLEDRATPPATGEDSSVRTYVLPEQETELPMETSNSGIGTQRVTVESDDIMYSSDLRMRSIQTAYGYSNVSYDIRRIIYPDSEDALMHKYMNVSNANIATNWKPFSVFDKITATQAGERIANYTNADYRIFYEDEHTIKIKTDRPLYFILRSGRFDITSVTGGNVKQSSRGIWMISVTDEECVIELDNQYVTGQK